RDSAAGREARARVAGAVTRRFGGTGADEERGQAGRLIPTHDVAPCLQERDGKGPDSDCTKPFVLQCHGSNVGPMGALRAGNGNETGGVPFVAGFANTAGETQLGYGIEEAPPITTRHGDPGNVLPIQAGDLAHTLRAEGFDASEDGTGRGTPIVVSETGKGWWTEGASALRADPGGMPSHIAFTCKDSGQYAGDQIGRAHV